MANVTLVVSNFIYPQGELQPAMFPNQGELTASIGEWLEEAASKSAVTSLATNAEANEAATHWVYYRAYQAVAQRIALQPSSESRGDIDRSWGQGRIDYFAGLSASHKATFDGMSTTISGVGMGLFTVAKSSRVFTGV